tara:strand:+ start:941 stop:1198 length:258 start_codon:yes stop_codon:yes gene_type:complete
MIANTIRTVVSSLNGGNFVGGQNDMSDGNLIIALITLVIFVLLLLFVGKYIWNEVLIQVVPGIKPLENPTQLLLLWILLNMLFGR